MGEDHLAFRGGVQAQLDRTAGPLDQGVVHQELAPGSDLGGGFRLGGTAAPEEPHQGQTEPSQPQPAFLTGSLAIGWESVCL